jgi:hypothetical protein
MLNKDRAVHLLVLPLQLLLVCEESEVSSIVGNLKGYSSYEFHRLTPSSNHTVNRMVADADDGAGADDTATDDGAADSTSDRLAADAETDTANTSHTAEPTPTYSDGTIQKLQQHLTN